MDNTLTKEHLEREIGIAEFAQLRARVEAAKKELDERDEEHVENMKRIHGLERANGRLEAERDEARNAVITEIVDGRLSIYLPEDANDFQKGYRQGIVDWSSKISALKRNPTK